MRKIISFILLLFLFMIGTEETIAQKSKTKTIKKSKKIGLALSGGGALGYTHIGFLQAMKESGLEVDIISGTSMGSIIGGLYAQGYSPIDILDLVEKENMNKMLNVVKLNLGFRKGFFNHEKLLKILERTIPHNDFSQLKKKFYCCVTDLNNASYKFVGEGNLLKEYIAASASIPIIYEPIEIDSIQYIDGGLMQNLPVEPLVKEKCDIIIGVNVVYIPNKNNIKGVINIISRSISIAIMGNTKNAIKKCNYVITPKLDDYSILDFDKAEELFDIGYDAGKEFFKKNKIKK